MARKKEAVALQKEVFTDEEFETTVLEHNGVCVVDVYQEWCGPCKAIVALFRRLKNELSDDLLGFAVCKADTISSLGFYRGRCMPVFLFYAGGKLQAVIRGCNAPLLEQTVQECLTYEHKVQDGQAQRKEVADPEVARIMEERRLAEIEAKKPKPKPKKCSVMIIKPDAVANGQAEEILENIKESGIEVLTCEERLMTEEEVRHLYSAHEEEPWFEELVEFMTSGPSWVIAVTKGSTGESVVPDLRLLVGPVDSEEAKEAAPDTLRAKYGSEKIRNAVHAADSADAAAMELAFFFPDFAAPMQDAPGEPKQLQRTLALIRPDAYRLHGKNILSKIEESGFQIAMSKEIQLTREQVVEFYKDHEGQDYFDSLVESMIAGPVLALGLAREDAISQWRDLLGPKEKDKAKEEAPDSLRAQFDIEECPINSLHGATTEEQAQKELDYFFPKEKTLLAIKPNAINQKEAIISKIQEAGFQIEAQKEVELTKEIAAQIYSEHEGKDFYDNLTEFMSSGETLFLVLQKENALNDLIKLSGNKDPQLAQQEDPATLRAMFGESVLHNGIHRASSLDEATKKISLLFEDSEVVAGEEEGMVSDEGDREGSGEESGAVQETDGEDAQEETPKVEEGEKDETVEVQPQSEETVEDQPQSGETVDDQPQSGETVQDQPQNEETGDLQSPKDEEVAPEDSGSPEVSAPAEPAVQEETADDSSPAAPEDSVAKTHTPKDDEE